VPPSRRSRTASAYFLAQQPKAGRVRMHSAVNIHRAGRIFSSNTRNACDKNYRANPWQASFQNGRGSVDGNCLYPKNATQCDTATRARSRVLPGQHDKENERLPHAGFPLRNVAGRTGRAMDVTQSHRHARHNGEAVRVPSTPCIRNHAPCSHKSTGPRCAGHARFAGPEDPSGPGCWATFLTCPGC